VGKPPGGWASLHQVSQLELNCSPMYTSYHQQCMRAAVQRKHAQGSSTAEIAFSAHNQRQRSKAHVGFLTHAVHTNYHMQQQRDPLSRGKPLHGALRQSPSES
jgi:hypothetical protein